MHPLRAANGAVAGGDEQDAFSELKESQSKTEVLSDMHGVDHLTFATVRWLH